MVVLVALFLMWGHVDREPALAQGPAMSLNAPASVSTGETFTVIIMADPAPDIEVAGFGTEVFFDAGMEWLQRPNCEDEALVRQADGEPLVICFSFVSALSGGTVHGVLGEVASRPLTPLDLTPGSTAPLIELDFRCLTAGSHTLTLTALPDSPDGAVYGDVEGNEIRVETKRQDHNGDTTLNDVADSVTINCEGPAVSASPRPTATEAAPGSLTPGAVEPSATQISEDDEEDDGDGISAGLWAIITAVLAVAIAGLAVFGWRYARSR